jgi:SAM-dependent methyltransferase
VPKSWSEDASTTWGLGAYPLMAERLVPAASATVEACGIEDGDVVLDLACGTGNAALLAAGRGAVVHGVDFEPRLLSVASRRAAEQGLEIDWRVGELSSVPLADASVGALVSVFGAMYAPEPADAASELGRLCARGARLALTAWAADSFMPALGAALGPYLPPPPGSPDPGLWASSSQLEGLLGAHGIQLEEMQAGQLELRFEGPPQAADFLMRTAGHLVAARDSLRASGRWLQLTEDLRELVIARSPAGDGRSLTLDYVVARAEKL